MPNFSLPSTLAIMELERISDSLEGFQKIMRGFILIKQEFQESN